MECFLINLIEKILLKIDKKISLNAREERKVVNDLNYLQFWCEKNLENLIKKFDQKWENKVHRTRELTEFIQII